MTEHQRPQGHTAPLADAVAAALPGWRRHLAALGGPNALLWFGDHEGAMLDLTRAHPTGLAKLLSGSRIRLTDLARESGAYAETRRRVRAVAADARHLEAAHGLHTCFVAMGMATWALPAAPGRQPRTPAAPVLLRSCRLLPSGALQSDYMFDLGPVELNPALEHYLRSEAGVAVDRAEIERLAEHDGQVEPSAAYAALTDACAALPGFTVEPRVVLATFTPTKVAMVADLATRADDLSSSDIIGALAGSAPPTGRAPLQGRGPDAPVLHTDSTQDEVVAAVCAGADVVVDAAPGTGATQAVAALVAALAADGRRVLLTSGSRRGVADAVARLAGVGLGDLVLDLGDGPVTRGALADRLGGGPAEGEQSGRDIVAGAEHDAGAELERHTQALHEPCAPWGVSLYAALEAVSALAGGPASPHSRVRWRGAALERLDQAGVDGLAGQLTELAERGAWRVDRLPDPWWGARVATEAEAAAVREAVGRLAGDPVARARTGSAQSSLDTLDATMREVFSGIALPSARVVGDWGRLLTTVSGFRDTFEVFRSEIFDGPIAPLVEATAPRSDRESSQSAWERRQHRRAARQLLRPGRPPADLHAALRAAMEQRGAWRELAGAGSRPEPPAGLDRAQQAYDAVAADLRLVAAHAPGGGDLLEVDRAELTRRLVALASAPERLAVVPAVDTTLAALRQKGFGALVDDVARRGIGADTVAAEVQFVWWASLVDELSARQGVAGHDGRALRRRARALGDQERARLRDNAARVREVVGASVADVLRDAPDAAAHLAEAAAAADRAALPALLDEHRDLLGARHPCWAVSPLAAAAVLPQSARFDVAIIDEADRLHPAEVVSVLARADRVVAVGDLSLARWRPDEGDEGSPAPDTVVAALAATLPVHVLRRDYRSHDERLTTFVRDRLYAGLESPPGVEPASVVRHTAVDGTGLLDPTTQLVETTDAEVSAVVATVLEQARTRPGESVAVITVGERHAERVESALRAAVGALRHTDAGAAQEGRAHPAGDPPAGAAPAGADLPGADPAGADPGDPPASVAAVPVLTMARALTGVWDHVVLSVGYGRTPHGRMLHRFGPLSEPGGDRDLVRALTRARRRLTVVSAFTADDLDADQGSPGPWLLRDLLAHLGDAGARRSEAPESGSSLARELAEHLRGQGLLVRECLGRTSPVDLAVKAPGSAGRAPVAVETDGVAYAALPSPRERDVQRVEHLERLGWRHARVWSIDIFRDPAPDVERIRALAVGDRPTVEDDTAEDPEDATGE